MITFERVTKANIQEKIAEIEKHYSITRCFFGNPFVMHVFLNLNGPEVFVAKNETEIYLIVMKRMKAEYRFLGKAPSEAFVEELKAQERVRYITTNLISELTGQEVWLDEEEIVLDVEKVLALADHDFRKQYRQAEKKNPQFDISSYDGEKDNSDVLVFLESWRNGRTEELNAIAMIENDLNFLASYGRDPKVKGVVIRHEGRVIAYCLYVPYFENVCTSVFSKILRGYENLGVVLTVEKCKAMKQDGFSHAYLANANNGFKKSLGWAGEKISVYAERVYKDEGMTFNNYPEKYLHSIRG